MKQHYEDLQKYVKSLSKAELQERLYNALIELEEAKHPEAADKAEGSGRFPAVQGQKQRT